MSKKNSEIKDRLREYTVFKGFSQRKFNNLIDASDSFLKSDGGFNVDFLPKIRQKCPDLNIDWLVFNEGGMILSSEKKDMVAEESTEYKSKKVKNELSLLGLNSKVDDLTKELNLLKNNMFQIIEDKLNEAINNKEI